MNKKYKIGKYIHRHLGEVVIDEQCLDLQKRDGTKETLFVVYQGEIREVTKRLVEKIKKNKYVIKDILTNDRHPGKIYARLYDSDELICSATLDYCIERVKGLLK